MTVNRRQQSIGYSHCYILTSLRRLLPFVTLFALCTVALVKLKLKASDPIENVTPIRPYPDRFIGSTYRSCNGIANQMYRFASLYGIGTQIGREPYEDGTNDCNTAILPELAAAMPNYFERMHIIVTPKPFVKLVRFANDGCCKFGNVSELKGIYPNDPFVKVTTNLLQSYKYFHPVKEQIRHFFEFSPAIRDYVRAFADELYGNDTNHKVCLHSRLGDFKGHSFLLPSTLSFSNLALEFVGRELSVGANLVRNFFQKQFPNMSAVLIGADTKFSQKIFVNSQLFANVYIPRDLSRTQEIHFGAAYCDSFLLTSSGSTFGWWMAYLMPEEAQDRVFYNYLASKTKKFGKDRHDFDTFPPEWRRLRMADEHRMVYENRWHRDIGLSDAHSFRLHGGVKNELVKRQDFIRELKLKPGVKAE